MNDHFHLDLDSYRMEVVWYGRFSLDMLKNALFAFSTADVQMASDILRRKDYVCSQYEHLNERGILLIALNQPMAADLRCLACCMDVVTSSERIGRYGKDVAELVCMGDAAGSAADIARMGELTVGFLNAVYNVFESGDLSLLSHSAEWEEEIDALYTKSYHTTIAAMEDGSLSAGAGAGCLLTARYLERCGDHACRMGEKIYYMHTGKRVPFSELKQPSDGRYQ